MSSINNLRGAVFSFVNRLVPVIEDKSNDIFKYGDDNLLPNKLQSWVSDSGVARRSVSKLTEYIASDGFVEESSALLKVNENQIADDLLQECANYYGYFNGFALHISRNAKGEVASVKSIPFQCCRQKLDLRFIEVNLTYGQPKFDKSKSKSYPKFYGAILPTELLSQDSYRDGEIYYAFRKTADNAYYPIPDYYAGIEDIRTSSEVCKMDLELALQGFMPSMMITVVGDVDSVNKDAAGKTAVDYLLEDYRVFTGQEKDSSGLSSRFKALVNFAKTKEQVPVMQTLDIKSILESSNSKREIVERSISRLFGINPVLNGYSDAAVLGNTNAISNASIELNKVANPAQRLITAVFNAIYPKYNWSISEYMPITYVDSELYSDMTQDERRNKFLGLDPIQTEASGDADKTIKALTSLSPLVANKVLESLSKDEIRALIGLAPDTTQTTPNVTVN